MTDFTMSAGYSARPYDLRLHVYTTENNASNNTTVEHWDLFAVSREGYGTYDNTCATWDVWINGQHWSGCTGLNFSSDYSGKAIFISSGDIRIGHDGNGYANAPFRMRHGGGFTFGNADSGDQIHGLDRVPKVPAKVNAPTASNVMTTSMTLSWNIPDNMGSAIDQMLLRYSTDPTMTTYTNIILGPSVTSQTVTGLTPGTTYNWWVYARNGVGYSERSDGTAQSTIPATAPGITVAPTLSGLEAKVTVSPPGGTSGVTLYNIEYRELNGSSTATTTTTTVKTITGLTPGKVYQYRANAIIGGYTSPWSSWVNSIQPNPNRNPGDFYDGSTAPTSDLTYSWSGPAEISTSLATAAVPAGWLSFGGMNAAGGTGTVSMAVGGLAGAKSVRVSYISDCTGAGHVAGIGVLGAADIQPSSVYWSSIHVSISGRSQRVQGGVAYYDSSGERVGTTWGNAVLVAASNTWTRLTLSDTSPPTAVKAAPIMRDVSGTGWSVWRGGDVLRLDAAMVSLADLFPYFDGETMPSVNGNTLYEYQWVGAPHASPSYRTQVQAPTVDPLSDPDCATVTPPPQPPQIASDCIDEVGVWRRYTVTVPQTYVSQWASTLPTLILTTGAVAERQVRIRYHANEDNLPAGAVDLTHWVAEMILTYIPPQTVMTLDGVTQRVGAEVNGGSSVIANHLLYGTNGVPASWPELRCGIGYVVTLDVPLAAPSGNLTTRLQVTQRA